MASKGNRAAQGAISGAGAGASIGSVVPGIGTGIGAGIGGGLGALMGLFGNSGEKPMSPELEALFQQQLGRQEDANPMMEAVMRLAFSRMPMQDRQGLEAPSLDTARTQLGPDLSQSANGDYNESPQIRKVLQLQRLRQQMANPIYAALQHLAQRRMPMGFQGQGSRVQTGPFQMPSGTGIAPDDPNAEQNRG